MKIVFMGTPQAAVPCLERCLADGHEVVAVYTQPDRPAGRGNRLRTSAIKDVALSAGLAVLQPTSLKADEVREEFIGHKADLAVVVAYGRILPEHFLRAFPLGAINVHFSLLPKYRGAAPVNWAIVNGETETGVTTMKMDTGLDTGDILLQVKTEIGANEDAIELMERLSHVGAEVLSETLLNIANIIPEVQLNENATLAPILKREDGRIDWNKNAKQLRDQIRGFQPFPSTFSIFRDSKVTFWSAEVVDPSDHSDTEFGTIESVDNGSIYVACSGGSVLNIKEIQPEGKRRMSARDFINGQKPLVGERFS